MMNRLTRRSVVVSLGSALAVPSIRRARAATPLTVGYTATLGFNGAFIAKDQGLFAKHGLDVSLLLIGLNSNMPAAMMGGSIQIGGPTPTVLLQAAEGGVDLVVVAGCSGVDPDNRYDGLLVRKGVAIDSPAACIGKKIGVPGLNAYYHVAVRKWLGDNKVDWRRVNFVEVPFTQSADVLRSGSVDAVATGEPFSTRILNEGIGTLLARGADMVPRGTSGIFYAAMRDWAEANLPAVHAFRAALADAIRSQEADPAAARASAGKFIKLPPEVLATLTLPVLQGDAMAGQVQFWADVMTQQGMLERKPDPAKMMIQ